jgi:glycosyltransferase involved in cell wall biosynthesis
MVVFASLYEGFGLPILEAQAMGRPVITSNFGAMREAAGDGALLVDPYSVEAIREAVLRIKREPALREDLIAKGRENAERFRAEAVAARYAELYRNLATADRRETDSSKS